MSTYQWYVVIINGIAYARQGLKAAMAAEFALGPYTRDTAEFTARRMNTDEVDEEIALHERDQQAYARSLCITTQFQLFQRGEW